MFFEMPGACGSGRGTEHMYFETGFLSGQILLFVQNVENEKDFNS